MGVKSSDVHEFGVDKLSHFWNTGRLPISNFGLFFGYEKLYCSVSCKITVIDVSGNTYTHTINQITVGAIEFASIFSENAHPISRKIEIEFTAQGNVADSSWYGFLTTYDEDRKTEAHDVIKFTNETRIRDCYITPTMTLGLSVGVDSLEQNTAIGLEFYNGTILVGTQELVGQPVRPFNAPAPKDRNTRKVSKIRLIYRNEAIPSSGKTITLHAWEEY